MTPRQVYAAIVDKWNVLAVMPLFQRWKNIVRRLKNQRTMIVRSMADGGWHAHLKERHKWMRLWLLNARHQRNDRSRVVLAELRVHLHARTRAHSTRTTLKLHAAVIAHCTHARRAHTHQDPNRAHRRQTWTSMRRGSTCLSG